MIPLDLPPRPPMPPGGEPIDMGDPIFTLESGKKVRVGDWLLVRAQVVPDPHGHPEDVFVRLASHNEEYRVLVHQPLVVDKTSPPEGWPTCSHLLRLGAALVQCALPDSHGGRHEVQDDEVLTFWNDEQTTGYFEGR